MILYLGKIKLISDKHKEPKFSTTQGKKWKTGYIYIDGQKIKCHFDEKHGNNIYFSFNNHPYIVAMKGEYYHIVAGVLPYSFNPLEERVEFSTTMPDSLK